MSPQSSPSVPYNKSFHIPEKPSQESTGAKKKIILQAAKPRKEDKYSSRKAAAAAEEEAEKENATGRKKNRFVSLYGQDGNMVTDMVLLKGRHRCNCQSVKHKLVNNCINCGRIVCEQEGSGPCLFCGHLVCSEEQQRVIESATKKGENLKKSLMEQQRPKGWEEAMTQRNRLLEYNRTSEKRTTVIDDEADYFKANSVWLSETEKKKLHKLETDFQDKRHSSRLNKKLTVDFTGRVLDDSEQLETFKDEVLDQIARMGSGPDEVNGSARRYFENSDDVAPNLDFPAPIFDDALWPTSGGGGGGGSQYDGVYNRVQDKELMELSDMRNCLSMHQPWASLLVAGIKKHEGRSWYTAHRGRLWIASTAKAADPETVRAIEDFYRKYYNNPNLEFPAEYPNAVLLGHVSVADCLSQEEYKEKHPHGESDSPYVFICNNTEELPIRFPVSGAHKICE